MFYSLCLELENGMAHIYMPSDLKKSIALNFGHKANVYSFFFFLSFCLLAVAKILSKTKQKLLVKQDVKQIFFQDI